MLALLFAPATGFMTGSIHQKWGKLPDSVSMAGACPIVVGAGGKKVAGYSENNVPVRKDSAGEFVYDSRAALGTAIGASNKAPLFKGKVVPTGRAMLQPMNFN